MTNKIFFFILALAFVLRLYKLGEVPFSLDWDENSNAYNAYSILKTGRDEYGGFLPITNRSFDDYKPPMYMYLNVPSVAIFGLTPFAARLPSAIFGFLTVPMIYFLAKKLFEKSNLKFSILNSQFSIEHLAMLMLAISPWHLQFSRVGFEATVGLFFTVASITAFLYGLDNKQSFSANKKWLVISGILLGLSTYTYHSQRIFVPLIFIATFLIWRKNIFLTPKKYLLGFVLVTVLVALPLVILIPPKVILQRFEVTTGRPRLEDIERSIKLILQDREVGLPAGHIIHNRRLVIGQTWLGNYLSHFDFNFLFTKGDDNFRHHIEGMGMLYLFEMPLILFGLYQIVKRRERPLLFVLVWLLLSPIAATPAVPNPHGNRALPMVIAFEIIVAYALVLIFSKNFIYKRFLILSTFSLWIVLSFSVYLHNYWSHYPFDKADFWQFGYREAVLESEKLKNQYEKINIDHSIEQAYAFWLFNTKYDPRIYQKEGSRYHFDKYYFDAKAPSSPKELFIADGGNFPGGFEVIKIIYKPNGEEAVKIGHPK